MCLFLFLLLQVTQNSVKEYMMELAEDMEMDNRVLMMMVVENLLDLEGVMVCW
jgi:hypothetical protein